MRGTAISFCIRWIPLELIAVFCEPHSSRVLSFLLEVSFVFHSACCSNTPLYSLPKAITPLIVPRMTQHLSSPVSPLCSSYSGIPVYFDIRETPILGSSSRKQSRFHHGAPNSRVILNFSNSSNKALPPTPSSVRPEPVFDVQIQSASTPSSSSQASTLKRYRRADHNISHQNLLKPPPLWTGTYGLPSRPDTAKLDPNSSFRPTVRNRRGDVEHGTSPIQTKSEKKRSYKTSPVKEKSGPNLAQRIETNLWRYNSSRNVITRWLLEIISWTLSFLCMNGIIILLIILNDRELPRLPLDITLNALISVLSRIASAALLLPTTEALGQLKWIWFGQKDSKKLWDFEIFDEASRGPWGSFLLLIRTKGKSLAALGAAITILVLALDPFFQQVISFPQRWVVLDRSKGNSNLPTTIFYQPVTPQIRVGGKTQTTLNNEIQTVAQQFFYENGTKDVALGNGTRPNIPVSCPTSNCTWPDYTSLGVCSACADISNYLEYACVNSEKDWTAEVPGMNFTGYPIGPACGFFLNATGSKPVLMAGYLSDSNHSLQGEALTMRLFPLVSNPTREIFYGGSINFKQVRDTIVDFLIVGVRNPEDIYANKTPVAQECILTWCTKTFKSSYYWAKYNETITEQFVNLDFQGKSPWRSRVNKTAGTVLVGYDQSINITHTQGNISTEFYTSNETALQTISVFDEILPGFVTTQNVSSDPTIKAFNGKIASQIRPYLINYWLGDSDSDIPHFIGRLATSMTDVIRSSQNTNTLVTGTASDLRVFVEVRWPWLSLPLALLFASFAFLTATIIRSTKIKSQVGIWKTSAVATLLYGLPGSMREKVAAMTEIGTPRTTAKEFKVKLSQDKNGWRVSDHPRYGRSKPRTTQEPNWI